MSLRESYLAQPKSLVYLEAVALTLAVGWVDYVTEWEMSLFVFYAFPILMVVWVGDRRTGILFAVACALVWHFANASTQPYRTIEGYILAILNRLVYFVFVAIGGTAMRRQREDARARIEGLIRTRELQQEIVRVSESEQIRIGQDLHDGLCQSLAAIDCAAACLRADLDTRNSPEAGMAATIQKMLKEAVAEARSIARGIFPVQVDSGGLAAAIEELVATTNQLRQISATFSARGGISITDTQVAMHLYRITQEALSNAVRHSGASHISIDLHQDGSRLALTIVDDGCGLAQESSGGTGMGLRTMRYRAQLIGAELEMSSEPRGGTVVRCTLALPS